MIFKHIPIMLSQCIDGLDIKEDGVYIDATIGGAGHSAKIADRLSKKGTLIGIDRDKEALTASKERLSDADCKVILVHSNYSNIRNILNDLNIDKVDGILADLGVSSYQLDNKERGFSYRFDSPLDMRMNKEDGISAYDVVNTYSTSELIRIIRDYGEEKYAVNIARSIVKAREQSPVKTTFQLRDIVLSSLPGKSLKCGNHMEKRTFQAVRIEVNKELELLKQSLEDFIYSLKVGGRLAVITFHSLEDRITKSVFKEYSTGCTCPKDFPVCVCNNIPKIKLINKKPYLADEGETANNSRSKSAKLRIIEKVENYEV